MFSFTSLTSSSCHTLLNAIFFYMTFHTVSKSALQSIPSLAHDAAAGLPPGQLQLHPAQLDGGEAQVLAVARVYPVVSSG